MDYSVDKGAIDMSRLTMAFLGDICFGRGLKQVLAREGAAYFFSEVEPVLQNTDLVIGNLEFCIVSEADEDKLPVMAVPKALCRNFNASKIDIFNLANNHVMDAGEAGLKCTLDYLMAEGCSVYGAGVNESEAVEPLLLVKNGLRLGIVGATDASKYYCSRTNAGVSPLKRKQLVSMVGEISKKVDLVVVTLHSDLEFTSYPSPWRIRLSRQLVDAGANLVIQHHPHVTQGVEEYNGGLIAYSLGNFVFPIAGHRYMERYSETSEGHILRIEVVKKSDDLKIKWNVVPVRIGVDGRPYFLSNKDMGDRFQRFSEISEAIRNKKFIRLKWLERCKLEAKITWYSLVRSVKEEGLREGLRIIASLALKPEERRWVIGFLSRGIL